MAVENEFEAWWDKLTKEQQQKLKQTVSSYPGERRVIQMLISTGCPVPDAWALTAWTSSDEPPALTLHGPLEKFIQGKLDDQ